MRRIRGHSLCGFALLFAGILLLLYSNLPNTPRYNTRRASLNPLKDEDDLPVSIVVLNGRDEEGVSLRKERSAFENFSNQLTCRIPRLSINASDVIGFYKKLEPLNCTTTAGRDDWIEIDAERRVRIKKRGARCTALEFSRHDDNELFESTDAVFVEDGQPLPFEYATVQCSLPGSRKWSGIYSTVKKQENATKKVEWNDASPKPLSVYIVSFDSLSQMAFRRTLPKSMAYLERIGAVVFNGYNIVGDGTPQAFIPILTGKTELELPLTRKRYKTANYVDDVYPFIWNNFSQRGYATLFGEDMAAVGMFTYRLKGFKNQPTAHYLRTLFQKTEPLYGTSNCWGSRTQHEEWFRYAREFLQVYEDRPRFSVLHHSLLSHDDINLIQVADESLENHLRDVVETRKLLDDGVLIVMADHGHRFAKLRETAQGQLEERLPFFSIRLPEKFKATEQGRKIEENLRANADRLASPFDVYSTFWDILDMPTMELLTKEQDASANRSLSLFRPIPSSRTCQQAGIEPHWCVCLAWQPAAETDRDRHRSTAVARAIVDVLNKRTEQYRDFCAPLQLAELVDAHLLSPDSRLLAYNGVKDADGFVPKLEGKVSVDHALYQVKIRTAPGGGLYEATAKYDYKKRTVEVDLAAIQHVNAYGDQPHCVVDKDFFVAPFCVCWDKVEAGYWKHLNATKDTKSPPL